MGELKMLEAYPFAFSAVKLAPLAIKIWITTHMNMIKIQHTRNSFSVSQFSSWIVNILDNIEDFHHMQHSEEPCFQHLESDNRGYTFK
jgi:hypothetical protein